MGWVARCFSTIILTTASVLSHGQYQYSDSHLHIVDFFQRGEPLTELIAMMDKHKIDHAMISGIPLMKKWHEDEPKRPRYYSGDNGGLYWYSATDTYLIKALDTLTAQQRKRLHPFIVGFNPTDKNAGEQLEALIAMYPGVWQGIGEVLTRHDDLTALTQDEPPRANSEAMEGVYRVAQRYGMPVMLHSNITSKRERNPLYLGELKEALQHHPDVNFIWAHAGTSKTLHRYQGKMAFLLPTLKQLLAEHDNLYIDLSWTVLRPYILDKGDQPDPDWLALIKRYPDRFMIGSDALGKYDNIGSSLDDFLPLLDALPRDVAEGVARDNFLRLLPEPAVADKPHPLAPKNPR